MSTFNVVKYSYDRQTVVFFEDILKFSYTEYDYIIHSAEG